ncbi:MAG TPA: PEGA domain-containing protein [Methylomirabilota bacterium]|nr:PEGA domain-containing protein [Methylomirabilota bacterium]
MKTPKQQPVSKEEQAVEPKRSIRRQIAISLFVLFLLVISTILVILYGKGYRFGFQQGEPKLSKTGILQVTSKPTGAQVYVDGHLTTATDNSLNLTPGKYTIKISKDGYNDWQKDIEIQREVVIDEDALLLPKAPTLQSISAFGVEAATMDPSGTKLAFKIASDSAKKNGIYVLDMANRSFPVLAGQSNSTQLVDDTLDLFSQADLIWSPDGKQILAKIPNTTNGITYYLLKTDGFNDTPQDITATLKTTTDLWASQLQAKETARLKSLKAPVQKFAHANFHILSWSPDENKILYQASESAQMPIFIKPRIIGNNLLYERRDLKKGAIYVYDIKEDINTRLMDTIDDLCTTTSPDCMLPFSWFPDSHHLLSIHDKKIGIIEDDGSNLTTMYAGPFVDYYVFPWPDGSKIVILTNLNNAGILPTLYTIALK